MKAASLTTYFIVVGVGGLLVMFIYLLGTAKVIEFKALSKAEVVGERIANDIITALKYLYAAEPETKYTYYLPKSICKVEITSEKIVVEAGRSSMWYILRRENWKKEIENPLKGLIEIESVTKRCSKDYRVTIEFIRESDKIKIV
jgi:hypothetical protein